MIYFESERLIFRDWVEPDKMDFRRMNSDPEVMEFFLKPLTAEESDAFLQRIVDEIKKLGFGLFAVETKCDGEFIGYIGFSEITSFQADFTPAIEIGWRLCKEAWGKGYATEGAKACLEYAEKNLNLDKVYSMTAKINLRSQKVMKKIGMVWDRDFLRPTVPDGHPLKDHVLYVYHMKGK
jgi:ribosomal-protein-alanine N-acetyltransferase